MVNFKMIISKTFNLEIVHLNMINFERVYFQTFNLKKVGLKIINQKVICQMGDMIDDMILLIS